MSCSHRHPASGAKCENPKDNHKHCIAYDVEKFQTMHWPNPTYDPPKTVDAQRGKTRMTEIAQRTARKAPKLADAREAARVGSAAASQRWSDGERREIYEAIRGLATNQDALTTDDIWAACPAIAPGPGIAAILRRAVSEGIIAHGEFAASKRDRGDHDEGRQLRIWRSLVRSR